MKMQRLFKEYKRTSKIQIAESRRLSIAETKQECWDWRKLWGKCSSYRLSCKTNSLTKSEEQDGNISESMV